MKDGFRVYDSDTRISPAAEVLAGYEAREQDLPIAALGEARQ
jgi:hypothetical protein